MTVPDAPRQDQPGVEKDGSSLPQTAAPRVQNVATQAALAHASLLLQLAERCEREEPSSELSVDIELTLYPGAQRSKLSNTVVLFAGVSYPPPAYTSSIDDAVTLVPKGLSWFAGTRAEGGIAELYVSNSTKKRGGAYAPTAALALCAAALRARAHEATVEGKARRHTAAPHSHTPESSP